MVPDEAASERDESRRNIPKQEEPIAHPQPITINTGKDSKFSSFDAAIVLAVILFILDWTFGFNGFNLNQFYSTNWSYFSGKLMMDAFIMFVLVYVLFRTATRGWQLQSVVGILALLAYGVISTLLKSQMNLSLNFYSNAEFVFFIFYIMYVIIWKPDIKDAIVTGILFYFLINVFSIGVINSMMGIMHVILAIAIYFFSLSKVEENDVTVGKIILIVVMCLDLFVPVIIEQLGITDELFRYNVPILLIFTIGIAVAKKASAFNMTALVLLSIYMIVGVIAYASGGFGWLATENYLDDEEKQRLFNEGNPLNRFSKFFSDLFNQSIRQASGADYYTSDVDANAKKRLGVYLEDFDKNTKTFFPNEKSVFDATLTAENFVLEGEETYQSINITIACTAQKKDEEPIKGEIYPTNKFEITTYDVEYIQCRFPDGSLQKGENYEIMLTANFNFRTEAYLKRYFVSKENIDVLRRKGKIERDEEILTLNGITDKNPIAKNSAGPIEIKSSDRIPVIIKIDQTEGAIWPFAVEIENKWQGKISKIKDIQFLFPDAITREPGMCTPFAMEDHPAPKEERYDDYLLWKLAESAKENDRLKDVKKPLEQRCWFGVHPENIGHILNPGDVTTRYFRMMVNYEYQIEEEHNIYISEEAI